MTSNFGAQAALTVQSGGINSSLKGISYQVKLMLLAIIKSYQNPNNINFHISTEIKETDPFGDVILEVNGAPLRLIQCKSKENPTTLTFQDLFDKQKKTFQLAKYFSGYIKIKEKFNAVEDLIICSNVLMPNSCSLVDTTGSDTINFQKVNGTDEIFGNFIQRFKLDQNSKTTIRNKLIEDFKKQWPNVIQRVDNYLDEFLIDILFVFDLKGDDIDAEIDKFIQSQFSLSIVDCPKSILMCSLYGWIESLRTVKSINRKIFEDVLRETKDKSEIIPKVIDRSANIFISSKHKFKISTELSDFIKRIETGSNRLFYMQMEENDTFYGSCMVNQELNPKTSDEFLFLSSKFPSSHIEDGLKIFSMQNFFDFLIFVENKMNSIEVRNKEKIRDILSKNQKKKALIITDNLRQQFVADIIGNDENFLRLHQVKLCHMESLNVFLEEKQLKFQEQNVKLKCILDSSDQNLINLINLRDLEDLQSIGGNVIEDKNYVPDLYIERKLLQLNVIEKTIGDAGNNEKIVNDETSFAACCNQLPDANVHLLEPQKVGKNLVWKKSQGKIDFLLYYVDDEQGTPIQVLMNFQSTTQKTFVLVDIAGTGKTFWMNHLAQNMKKTFKDNFVVNISFNDYTEYFQDHKFEDEESLLIFFECEVLKLRSDVEKQIFRSACLKTGKVVVILDGLDEVCPDAELEMFKMFELVKKMKISGIFVSTRPELKRELEKTLQNFCHNFVPFSPEDQLNYLIKFWSKDRQGNASNDELLAVAEKVVLLIKKNNLTEITGISMIMRMVAEIFDLNLISEAIKNDSQVDNTISDLSQLYNVFVEKNIERYLTEKLKLDLSLRGNRRIMKSEKQKLITFYKKMALKLILPQHSDLFYGNFELTSDELEETVKCGLCDFKGKFIHRTIAEYLVSLATLEKMNDEKIAKVVINQIFTEGKLGVVRSFLDKSINKFSGGLELYGKILVEHYDECKKAAKTSCEEDNAQILEFIFESLFAWNSETKAELEFVLGILDCPFLKLYIHKVNDNFRFLDLIERKLGLETLRNLLLDKNFDILAPSVFLNNLSNCQLLLSRMRFMFHDIEFWEKFEKSLNKLFLKVLVRDYDTEVLHRFLHEVCLIEFEKKICCFEKLTEFHYIVNKAFTSSPYPESPAKFGCFLFDIKGFKIFMKIFFAFRKKDLKELDEVNELKYDHISLNDLVLLLNAVNFTRNIHLFGKISQIAFGQLLSRSTCQDQSFCSTKEIREKLMSEKLKTNLLVEDLNELQSLPEIFKISTGEDVEFVDEFAVQGFACLFFIQNFSNSQLNQIFFHDLVESDNFDEMGFGILYNLNEYRELFGRFVFDQLDYADSECTSQTFLMSAEYFCMKSKNKQFKAATFSRFRLTSLSPKQNFLFTLLRSMLFSVKSEKDCQKLNWILSYQDENHQTFDWPGHFCGFLKHCMVTIATDFEFSSRFRDPIFTYVDYFNFKDQEMILHLVQWIVEKYGHHHSLEYQDHDGNTVLHLIYQEKSYFIKILNILSKETLQKLLLLKNHQGETFLFGHPWLCDPNILEIIKEKCGYDFLISFLFKNDNNGNVLLAKCEYGFSLKELSPFLSKEIIKKLFLNRNFQEIGCDLEFFDELFNTKDENGETFLEYVERSRTSKDTPLFIEWNKRDTFEEFNNFIIQKLRAVE